MGRRHDEAEDIALVELARRDAGAGWSAIWDAHGHALHSYCRRLLDDGADADDVVADVFLVASRRIDQLRDPSALRAWLFAIARRSVQRRWRARQRTVPVDPQGTVMSARTTDETVDAVDGLSAGDAAELVAAAAVGLSASDQDLLALTLGADLDTSEVARITGEQQSAVSVRVTRLKDRVAKAAGALLVARHHRRDCEILDGILATWDGTFDTVWRKRIARHVESCETCDERRRGAVAVFASPLLLAPPSDALRERVLEPIRSVGAPAGGSADVAAPDGAGRWAFRDDGFPVAEGWPSAPRHRSAAILAVAAALLLFVVVGVLLAGNDDAGVDLAAVDAAVMTSTTAVPTTTSTAVPEATTSTAAPIVTPTDPPAGGLPDPGPTIAPPPPTDTAPRLRHRRRHPACGSTSNQRPSPAAGRVRTRRRPRSS